MTASTLGVVLIAVVVVLAAVRLLTVWNRYRGARLITCPENQRPAGVCVDAGHAAATALGFSQDLRLTSCSRWPEKRNCGQECLRQIEASPEDCLVRNILVRWYEGKECAFCGKPIGPIAAIEQKPALLTPERVTVAWADIPPEKLNEVLATARPVCFGCHLATTFAHQHPELVVDRSRPA